MLLDLPVLIERSYSVYMHLLCGATLFNRDIYSISCQYIVGANILGAQFLGPSPTDGFIKKQYFLPCLNFERLRMFVIMFFAFSLFTISFCLANS